MKMFQKFKEPRTLLVLVIVLAACGFGGLAILSQVSANPAFCVSCHNMQPEYDSYAQGNLLAKQHADAGVTCHDCHENPQDCADCHSMHHPQSAKKCTACHPVSWKLDSSWEK